MEHQQETFNVSVEINPGLEPLTFAVSLQQEPASMIDHRTNFKVTRDEQIFAVLYQDTDFHWKQIEGNIEQEQVDAIGEAITAHLAK